LKSLLFFAPKKWDSVFFSRNIYFADLSLDLSDQSTKNLTTEINQLDRIGCEMAEVRIRSSHFQNIPLLETLGFRLVDSRLEFRTSTTRQDYSVAAPFGVLRWFNDSDWPEVCQLTEAQFAGNSSFKSRYNSREYFSFDESKRYFTQWNQRVLDSVSPMFCIWEHECQVVGFYSVLRQATESPIPEYKVGLAAVKPELAKHGMANVMQYWIFQHAPDKEFTVINSPALTNLAGLKNNIRASKNLSHVEAFLFRKPK
jgi:hypothetical protein